MYFTFLAPRGGLGRQGGSDVLNEDVPSGYLVRLAMEAMAQWPIDDYDKSVSNLVILQFTSLNYPRIDPYHKHHMVVS